MNSPGAAAGQPSSSQPAKVLSADKTKWSLVVAGAVLVVLFVTGVVLARYPGNKSESIATPTTTAGEVTTSTASGAAATAPVTVTITKTTSKSWPSESLLTAVLTSGVVLIALGVLYYRITTVKLPGGGELDLNTDEQKKVENETKTKAEKAQIPEEQTDDVVALAEKYARDLKQEEPLGSLSDQKLGKAADLAVGAFEKVLQTAPPESSSTE